MRFLARWISLLLVFSAVTGGAAEPKFRPVQIDGQIQIGYGVAVADVDGDRRPDIVLADKNVVVWYRNPTWTKYVMAEKLTDLDHVCIAAADIDGDGKAEIAAGAGWNPGDTLGSGAVFYLEPPADRTQRWKPIQLSHEPTVHRMRWVKRDQARYDLVVAPLHGRGNQNGKGAGVRILAYRKPSETKQAWPTELLDDALHKTHNFNPAQWDNDLPEELIVAGSEGLFLLDSTTAGWTRTQLGGGGGSYAGAGEVRDGKLPGGKRFLGVIEPMHGNQFVVYTPPQKDVASGSLWQRQVVDESLMDGHAVACGDLAQAGYDQVVVGWRAMNRPGAKVGIKVFTPVDPDGKEWKQTLVDDNTMACEDLVLADLNGDGRLDIVAAGRGTKNLKVYYNER